MLIKFPPGDLSEAGQLTRFLAALTDVQTAGLATAVVDLSQVLAWDQAALESLRSGLRALADAGVEWRLVIWSRDLFQALQATGLAADGCVYSSVYAAWRALLLSSGGGQAFA